MFVLSSLQQSEAKAFLPILARCGDTEFLHIFPLHDGGKDEAVLKYACLEDA